MLLSGWGRNISIHSDIFQPETVSEISMLLNRPLIIRGMGRSYGDSSLCANVASSTLLNRVFKFDCENGIIELEAGSLILNVLKLIVPKGWFLPVTPGTSFVTIGGMIASDVHGKNHVANGCFSRHVLFIDILTGSGEVLRASATENSDLFRATCGGMGLTGCILKATIKLQRIKSSLIIRKSNKSSTLKSLIDKFTQYSTSEYQIGWINLNHSNSSNSKSIFMYGDHEEEYNSLIFKDSSSYSVNPIFSNLLNQHTSNIFNSFYYHFHKLNANIKTNLFSFFYPLDLIYNWNYLYGSNGLIQLQFVIPEENADINFAKILSKLSYFGEHSYLTVIKKFGAANNNYLSFPMNGYTLSMDLKASRNSFSALEYIHKMVLDLNGKIYLTKDSVLNKIDFQKCYPSWEEFENVRHKYNAIGKFTSLQSTRVGLL